MLLLKTKKTVENTKYVWRYSIRDAMRDVYTILSDGSPSRARFPFESRTSTYAGSGRAGGMGLLGTDRSIDDGV